MNNKTCWLVDEENGIATDGKRYWCAKKSWKCCEGMIELNHAVEVLAKKCYYNSELWEDNRDMTIWEELDEDRKNSHRDQAKELLE